MKLEIQLSFIDIHNFIMLYNKNLSFIIINVTYFFLYMYFRDFYSLFFILNLLLKKFTQKIILIFLHF